MATVYYLKVRNNVTRASWSERETEEEERILKTKTRNDFLLLDLDRSLRIFATSPVGSSHRYFIAI